MIAIAKIIEMPALGRNTVKTTAGSSEYITWNTGFPTRIGFGRVETHHGQKTYGEATDQAASRSPKLRLTNSKTATVTSTFRLGSRPMTRRVLLSI